MKTKSRHHLFNRTQHMTMSSPPHWIQPDVFLVPCSFCIVDEKYNVTNSSLCKSKDWYVKLFCWLLLRTQNRVKILHCVLNSGKLPSYQIDILTICFSHLKGRGATLLGWSNSFQGLHFILFLNASVRSATRGYIFSFCICWQKRTPGLWSKVISGGIPQPGQGQGVPPSTTGVPPDRTCVLPPKGHGFNTPPPSQDRRIAPPPPSPGVSDGTSQAV